MRRPLAGALGAAAVLAAAGAYAYAFGTPQAPEADPRSPLAIEIPGCRCHSDDPKVVAEHARYRMNQCAGCHKGLTPTGER